MGKTDAEIFDSKTKPSLFKRTIYMSVAKKTVHNGAKPEIMVHQRRVQRSSAETGDRADGTYTRDQTTPNE